MARLARFFRTIFTANVAVTTTNEIVVATLAGVSAQGPQCSVALRGWVQLTAGTNTTAVTLRIRRGTTTGGTLVGEANAVAGGVTAGATSGLDIETTDSPGEVASQSYVLTVQQTGASADGSALQGCLEANVAG